MNKVCDRFCKGIRPYELKKILLITIPFLLIGFLLLLTYEHIIIRYIIIITALISVIVKREQLIAVLLRLVTLRK